MARPRPCVLFAQSFLHPVLAEYVDEVRFTEPVVICACEFLELHTTSLCPTLSLSGASFPQSFALEIFVRIGGEARFKRLCPAFLYSPSASSILEVQAAVTDHLVIRGSYRALSLVVYGNSVKELGQFNFDHEIDNTLSDAIVPPEAVFQPEDLPEALQDVVGHQGKAVHPLRNLQLNIEDIEQAEAIHQLLSWALQLTRFATSCAEIRKVFELVLSAAAVVLPEHGIENVLAQLPTLPKTQYQNKGNVKNSILQARDQTEVVFNQWQNNVFKDKPLPALVDVPELLEGIFEWIQRSFQLPINTQSFVSMEEFLIVGLAAVQLICTDAQMCFQLVIAGGLDLLMSVLQYVSAESSAIALLILSALKCACQHAFACEAILGWWPANILPVESKHSLSFGYCSVLRTLLQTKRYSVSQLAFQILHQLHAYQLASEFECRVEALLENASSHEWPVPSEHTLKELSSYLKRLAKLLHSQDLLDDCSPAQTAHRLLVDGDDSAFSLPPDAIFSWISASKFSLASKDINKRILLILQERRFVPALAAVLSAPWMRSTNTKVSACFLEFIGSLETILLMLLNSRSGLLFLASEQEEATALISALMGAVNNEEKDFIDYRNANSLMSSCFICKPEDVGHMLYTNLSVISVFDRLLGSTKYTESFLWLLWELSVFSRSDAGKQALSCIAYFPEVFGLLVEALQTDSHSLSTNIREVRALNRAFIHSAAEVMQVILLDPDPSSLAAWVPHALSLQKALQYCSPTTIDMAVGSQGVGSNSKDALCARLLDWVDAAVIFHKKGPTGLLRYVAALVVGSVTSVAVGGLPASDPVEMDNTFGESAVSTELPPVGTLLGRGVTLGAAGTVLPDTAVIQLTVSMRIMSSISCHPGVAAVLFGEGAMSVLYILLEYGAGVLQSSTIDYDYMVEEDGEGDDGMTEMIMEQERELSLFELLLPTLLLLLTLLKRLQLTDEEYRNTRLVEVLLQLHRCTCSRLASKISVLPQVTGVILFASVLRVIASILSFWPVCGWKPSLFTKLVGLNALSLVQTNYVSPVEPREAISVLWILGDMLPEEVPQLCTNKILAMSVSQSLAVATLLGKKSMKFVNWHCQPAESEKLIQAMALQLEHISSIVSHLASTVSTLLQSLLTKLIVRMACVNQDYAATLLRPVLLLVKEQLVAGIITAENDLFRMEQFLRLLRELARHPETKRVLVQEGIVQTLLQAGKDKSQSTKVELKLLVGGQDSASSRMLCLVLDVLVAICDPDISLTPKSPLNVRLAKDCPQFSEYCAIASWAYKFILSLPLEKELDTAIAALTKLASHQLGRAAFASVALSIRKSHLEFQEETVPPDSLNVDVSEIGHQLVAVGSLVPFCRRLLAGLSETADVFLTLRILQHLALAGIELSAAGRSACGYGALHLFFEMEKETKETLNSVVSLLRSWVDSDANADQSLDQKRVASLKALDYVSAMLRILDHLPAEMNLDKKVKEVVDGLLSSQPVTREGSTCNAQAIGWRLLPQLFFDADETETIWNPDCMPDTDGVFEDSLKDKFTWECASEVSEKLSAGLLGKRKAVNAPEAGSKKHGVESGTNGPIADVASSVSGGLTGRSGTLSSVATSTRRDNFRQRKPNTSRPPSMHVDDYVARERGNEMSTGFSGSISQRSALGGGRPPSIHVDEFMARQRDRHLVVGAPTSIESHPPLVPQAQIQVETVRLETSTTSAKMSRPIMPEEDLQDVDIEVGMPDTDDLMSLPSGSEFVADAEGSALLSANLGKTSMELHLSATSVTVSIEPRKEFMSLDTFAATGDTQKLTPPQLGGPLSKHGALYGDIAEANLTRNNQMDASSSASLNLKLQMQQGMEGASAVGVSLQVQDSGNTSFSTPVSHVGEQGSLFPSNTGGLNVVQQRNHLQFNAAPPLPPPLPPPPPIPAGVIPEKFEVSSGGSKMPPLLPLSGSLLTTVTPPPPPPPQPSGSWQLADSGLGRIDQVHLTPISTMTYGMGPMVHQHNPQMGTAIGFSQAPLPPWPPLINEESGPARVAPPLPPTPPPFSTSQQASVVASGPVLTAPAAYQIGRIPSESTPMYTSHSTVESPSLDRIFPTFSPQIGQAVPHPPLVLPTFQPPLPPGRPNVSQALSVSGTAIQHHYHPAASQHSVQPIPTFQFSVQTPTPPSQAQSFQQPVHQTPPQQTSNGSQQQEPGNLLHQILASPEAIQDLLKDQNKLQSLLEQHPKLISLLQEKMGQS